MFASNTSQVSSAANYIEDVFSTYLYTGNGSTLAINNGIDLSTKGGLVWIKYRDGTQDHVLTDTARGNNKELFSNQTYPNYTETTPNISSFNTNGFGLQQGSGYFLNTNGANYVSWTFRKQPKFFDVVTFTTSGSTNQRVPHNLGSVPGCIICKSYDNYGDWEVYHRSLGRNKDLVLNSTLSAATNADSWGTSDPTTTDFGVSSLLLPSGRQYVAYLFAHDAGGFGTTGTDNVISCGSFTTNGSGIASVNLGYEPQWVLFKASSTSSNWYILDNMRGLDAVKDQGNALAPNLSNAEFTFDPLLINATGFNVETAPNPNTTYIYIAIRRGPMRTPTNGTSVYFGSANTETTGVKIATNFPVDLQIGAFRSLATNRFAIDRMRGTSSSTTQAGQLLRPNTTDAEFASSYARYWDNTGYQVSNVYADNSMIEWNFGRAPGYMDVVCYTGTGSATTQSHNLGVAPEFMLVKSRSNATDWMVYAAPLGNTQTMYFQRDNPAQVYPAWNNTTPTSTVFSLNGGGYAVNNSGNTYVAYLFASCPGVSKVGSYSGTGATQTISCGFAARFVLIKRTDDYADWLVWDTSRGMVSGTDPRLVMNLTSVEANANWVYTNASGFQIVTTDASVNASGGSYIFLAVGQT